jgi:hypothetical protein
VDDAGSVLCLYCSKRLGLFHDKKKPYCSESHEDSYIQRESLRGLARLRADQPGPRGVEELRMVGASPLLKQEGASRLAVAPVIEVGEEPGSPIPPVAPYWIPGPKVVPMMAPVLPPRSPRRAAFAQEELWGGAHPIRSSRLALSFDSAKIVPCPIVFPGADSDQSS